MYLGMAMKVMFTPTIPLASCGEADCSVAECARLRRVGNHVE